MRRLLPIYGFLCLVTLGNSWAEELPEFRSALLGNGPKSLVNMIDVDGLMKQGQGNASVQFSCVVRTTGVAYAPVVYRSTPGSTALQKEILHKLGMRAQLVPAIYKHGRQAVVLYGTVIFVVSSGKPQLRIFLNQEDEEIRRGNDFVAPQVVARRNKSFQGFRYPDRALEKRNDGTVKILLDVNEKGEVTDAKLASESPPSLGFADSVMDVIRDALFVPGHRNGKLVACRFHFTVHFIGRSQSTRLW
jgi:TonB family protein